MKTMANGVVRDMTPEEEKNFRDADLVITPPAPDPMQERLDKQEKKLDNIEGLCNSILNLLRGGRA